MANALTTIRLLLVGPFAFFMAHGDRRSAAAALLIFVLALATDFADGALARKRGEVSAFGGTYDHASDFLFVSAGMWAAAWRGALPWVLPALVAAAFAQYSIDSYFVHRRGKLRGSWLGRWNGILYFAPPCVDCVIRLGAWFLKLPLEIFVWLLVLSTLISMGNRLAFREKLPRGVAQK